MIREKRKALRVKLITIITLAVFLILHPSPFTLHPVLAADSTPSADIKSKLDELKKEIASKAAKLKVEVNRKLKDKSYIGKVKTKSDSTITLATKNGPRIVNINQDTEFNSSIRGKKYSQKLIIEEDYVAALGDVDETEVLTARKIILHPATTSEPKSYLWGQIISISDKLVTLKDRNLKNVAVSALNLSSVNISDFIILTGILGKNDIFEAEFVYVIPQGGIIKPKKIASPSATPTNKPAKTASPSAKPKPSPKPTSR